MSFALILLGLCYLGGIIVMAFGLAIPPEYYEDASGIHYYPRKQPSKTAVRHRGPQLTAA